MNKKVTWGMILILLDVALYAYNLNPDYFIFNAVSLNSLLDGLSVIGTLVGVIIFALGIIEEASRTKKTK